MVTRDEGSYVWILGDDIQEIAKKEINEIPEERASKIEGLRRWVKNHPYLQARTGKRIKNTIIMKIPGLSKCTSRGDVLLYVH
jgi:hypothetical protein